LIYLNKIRDRYPDLAPGAVRLYKGLVVDILSYPQPHGRGARVDVQYCGVDGVLAVPASRINTKPARPRRHQLFAARKMKAPGNPI